MAIADSPSVRVHVVCAGSHWHMGSAQGSGLATQIHAAIRSSTRQDALRMGRPWWLPQPAFMWLAKQKAWRLLAGPLAKHYPSANERLAGLAAGCGLNLKTVYLLNVLEPLLASVRENSVVPSLAACSAVAVRGRRSATGEPIIARNFDYLPFIQPYFALRESRPKQGFRAVEFTVAAMGGTIDGMNEKGLCITYNYAYTVDDGPPAAPISMIITETLERCATVAEAADWIAARPRWGGGILMLADAAGDIASLELSSTRSRLRRPDPDGDVLFHTNAFFTPAMREVEVSPAAVFTERAHPSQRGRRVLESADRRRDRLVQLLGHSGPLGADDLATVLADHGPDGVAGQCTLCVHGTARATTACVQMLPRSRRMRVAFDSACQARFEDISL